MTQVLKVVPNEAPKNGTTVEKIQPQKESKTAPSIDFEETSHRLNRLWELQSKFNRLQASKQKLKEFEFQNTDKEDIGLSIGMGGYKNEDFVTKNPEIVKEVVKFLTNLIDKKANEIKEQIRW